MSKLVVVDGNIGVGKTTFLNKVTGVLDAIVFHEDFVNNPHLADFYSNPKKYAYKCQEWFIRDRIKSYKKVVKFAESQVVPVFADRPPSSTMVFTSVMYDEGFLDEEEFKKLSDLYESLMFCVEDPSLYIFLKATPERCHGSIMERGREMEKNVSLDYIKKLGEKWESLNNSFFQCPIITLNWNEYDKYFVYSKIPELIGLGDDHDSESESEDESDSIGL